MIPEKIRTATAESHQRLEEKLFPLISNIQKNEDYEKLLHAFYGYIYPVQEKIVENIDCSIVPDMGERRNAAFIKNDLEALGASTRGTLAENIPSIEDHATAMGALYVLEGSTLGGKIISKTIAEKLGPDTPLGFFRGYGSETGPMWKKFTQYLDDPKNQPQAETIVRSAVETFTLFGLWFDKYL